MDIMYVKELAQYLKCSESVIRNLIRDNAIPYFRIGRKINFNKEAIDEWIRNQNETNQANAFKVTKQNEIRSIKNVI